MEGILTFVLSVLIWSTYIRYFILSNELMDIVWQWYTIDTSQWPSTLPKWICKESFSPKHEHRFVSYVFLPCSFVDHIWATKEQASGLFLFVFFFILVSIQHTFIAESDGKLFILRRVDQEFRYFLNFSALSGDTWSIEYHVDIWQVSPQLSCGGTCQIYTWFKESKRYFCQIENFACGEINEWSFSNTPPPPPPPPDVTGYEF